MKNETICHVYKKEESYETNNSADFLTPMHVMFKITISGVSQNQLANVTMYACLLNAKETPLSIEH